MRATVACDRRSPSTLILRGSDEGSAGNAVVDSGSERTGHGSGAEPARQSDGTVAAAGGGIPHGRRPAGGGADADDAGAGPVGTLPRAVHRAGLRELEAE